MPDMSSHREKIESGRFLRSGIRTKAGGTLKSNGPRRKNIL